MANSVDTGKNGDFAKDHSTTDLLRRLNSQFDADKVAERLEEYLFDKYCIEGDAKIDEIVKGGGINANTKGKS